MRNKGELVLSAIELVRVGKALEAAKNTLRALVAKNARYASEEMRKALADCQLLQAQWDALEERHLALKKDAATKPKAEVNTTENQDGSHPTQEK